MKKRVITIAAALMLAAAPAMAQVFIDDDDLNNRAGSPDALSLDNPGVFDSGEDWFTPVGEGLFVLAGLAGAYLLGKRKNEK